MKNKRVFFKILISIIIIAIFGIIFSNIALAWDPSSLFNDFEDKHAVNTEGKVTNIMGGLINITSIVGAGIAIIMLIVIGIKYVSAAPEGKAEAKKDLTGYAIGAVILFATSGILQLLQVFIEANFNN